MPLYSSSSPSPVAESTYSLDLAAELPDLLAELFLQLGKDLDTFTCFGRLHIELRLMIWRLTFPRGRHVNFNVNMDDALGPDYYRTDGIETHCPLPIALYVNSESRCEALNNYCIIKTFKDSPNPPYRRRYRPFCYNPKLDTAFLTYTCGEEVVEWMDYIKHQSPRLFSIIDLIEVRDWLGSADRVREDFDEPPVGRVTEVLFMFPRLKHVNFVMCHPSDDYFWKTASLQTEGGKIQFIEAMRDYMGHWGSWKDVPTISVQPWYKLRA